jgi:DNA-binding GntR family transcriptional regulator
MQPAFTSPRETASLRLGEQCYLHVKSLLLDGGLDPGDSVPVESLSQELKVSRQPVMEAIKRLAAEGFVHIIPQVGCAVTRPAPDDVDDFYRLFAGSEALIARLAAERRSAEEARTYAELAAVIAREAENAGSFEDRDPVYHHLIRRRQTAIHTMARSPVITQISASLWDRSNFYVRAALGSAYFTDYVKSLHRQIDQAVIDGDSASAEHFMHKYIDGGRPIIVYALRQKEKKFAPPSRHMA